MKICKQCQQEKRYIDYWTLGSDICKACDDSTTSKPKKRLSRASPKRPSPLRKEIILPRCRRCQTEVVNQFGQSCEKCLARLRDMIFGKR